MRLVFGAPQAVSAFLAEQIGEVFTPPISTIGVVDEAGNIVAGVAFTSYTGYGIEMTLAGRPCLSRSVRQAISDYVFGWLGCRRLAIVTRRSNKRVRRLAPRLGFTFEGRARGYYGEEDGLMYSLLGNEAIAQGHWTPNPKGYANGQAHAA